MIVGFTCVTIQLPLLISSRIWFYFVSYIACGRRFVVVSFCCFQHAIAGNNFKAVCDSVNNKVPVMVRFEVVYPGLSVKWGCYHGLWSIRSHAVGAVGCSCCG